VVPVIVGAGSRSSARALLWCGALVLTPFIAFIVVVEHAADSELLAFTMGTALIVAVVCLITYWLKALMLDTK
jgi:hypothetical protein